MISKLCLVLLLCVTNIEVSFSKEIKELYEKSKQRNELAELLIGEGRKRCPACDPSVYSYCSEKLFHDSCCCNDPNNPYYPLPPDCDFADCSFLHANSCYEHKLITACCCINQDYNNQGPYGKQPGIQPVKQPVTLIL